MIRASITKKELLGKAACDGYGLAEYRLRHNSRCCTLSDDKRIACMLEKAFGAPVAARAKAHDAGSGR